MPDIRFGKPDFGSLNSEGFMCVDMHFHSIHSTGASTIKDTLKKIRKLNIGVAITDHDEISGVLEAFREKEENDTIIPGIEVRTKENIDFLYYFYDISTMKKFYYQFVEPNKITFGRRPVAKKTRINLTISELRKKSRKFNYVCSVAHPFGYFTRRTFEEFPELKEYDIYEAINGVNPKNTNKTAIEFIAENNKGFTGGSDGHSIFELGNVITCSKAKNIKEFLDNIKSRKNKVIGGYNKLGKSASLLYFGINYLITRLKNEHK
ncbi:PHP domain-containing protein [Candidatus Woesearchaeota archaeon]|nr:PHP domain-containing protein [Candidatus Woesearchaeota archaeon]